MALFEIWDLRFEIQIQRVIETRWICGGVAERLKAAVLKTVVG